MNEKSKNRSLIKEAWDFLKIRKKWWLLPTLILLILVGALIIFGQSSSLTPFIYALG
jgi:hypothetical protein